MMFEYSREDELEARREDGYEEGHEDGENKLARLVTLLLRDGKEHEMQKILSNKSMRQEMYAQYGI